MALNETLVLDLAKARRDVKALGRELDVILKGAGGSGINITITGDADSELKQLAAEAKKASTEIKKLSQVDLEDTVAESLKETADAADDAAKASKGLNEEWKELAKRAAALVGAKEVFEFFRDSAKEASDTVEAINAVSKVYDESAVSIENFVEKSTTQLGFSGVAAREAAVQLGGLFQAFDFGQAQSAELSIELTKVAADLASIYNTDTPEAVRALSGIFRGEPEPARRYGLNITAAAIANEALRSGLVETKAEITENVKAQATYALIIEQTANTQNDFADTLETSLPNQLRVFTAELDNLRAEVGKQFQEPLLDGVKAIRSDVLPALQQALSGIDLGKVVSDATPVFVDFITTVIEGLPAVLKVVTELSGAFTAIAGTFLDLVSVLPKGVLEFGAVAIAADRAEKSLGKFDFSVRGTQVSMGKIAGSSILAADALRRVTDDGSSTADRLVGIGQGAAAGALAFGPWGAAVGGTVAALLSLEDVLRSDYDQSIISIASATDDYTDALNKTIPANVETEKAIAILIATYNELAGAVDGAAPAADTLADNVELAEFYAGLDENTRAALDTLVEYAGGNEILQEALDGDSDAVSALGNSMARLNDEFGQGSDEARLAGAAIDGMREAIANNIEATELDAKARFDNIAGLDAYERQVRDLGQSLAASGRTATPFTDAQEIINQQLIDFQVVAGDFTLAAKNLLPSGVSLGLAGFADQIDGGAVSAQGLVDALDGDVKTAVEGFLQSGLFDGEDRDVLADLIESSEFDKELDAAGVKIEKFLDTVEATTNERAINLAEAISTALSDKLEIISSQLDLGQIKINSDDSVDDFQEFINEAERIEQEFLDRRAAAAELRRQNAPILADQVEFGPRADLVDEVLGGNFNDELAAQAEAAAVRVNDIAAAAAADQAKLYELGFIDALINGDTDILGPWFQSQSFEISPEDLLTIAGQFQAQLATALASGVDSEAALAQRLAEGQAIAGAGDDALAQRLAEGAAFAGEGLALAVEAAGDTVNASLADTFASDEALAQRLAEGEVVGLSYAEGIAGGVISGIPLVVDAGGEMTAQLDAAARDGLVVESPSKKAIEIGEFFDEGLAEGLLNRGYTKEAAERLVESVDSVKSGLASSLQSVFTFDVPEIEESLKDVFRLFDPNYIEQQVDPAPAGPTSFEQVLNNIQEATRAAADEVQSLQQVEADRAAASARLAQFGDFENLQAAVNSGNADDLLKEIINNPLGASFEQIERELVNAQQTFGLDIFGTSVDAEAEIEKAQTFGSEFAFSATEGARDGFIAEGGATNAVIAEWAGSGLAEMNRIFDINSPSGETFKMGEFLDQGLADGLTENGFAQEVLDAFQLTAEELLPEEQIEALRELFVIAGELSATAFAEQLAGIISTPDSGDSSSSSSSPSSSSSAPASVSPTISQPGTIRLSVQTDVDSSPIDALTRSNRNIDFTADLDTRSITTAEAVLYDANFVATVDQTAIDALEQRNLNLSAVLGVSGVTVNGITFPAGGVVPLDRGGLMDRPALYAVSEVMGHPEMVAGAHHPGEQVVGWMDQAKISPNVEPIFFQRFIQQLNPEQLYSGPSGPSASATDSAMVAELREVKTELALIRASSAATSEHTSGINEIYEAVDAGARSMQRSETRPTNLKRGGAKL